MFKSHPDFGFEIDNSIKNEGDADADNEAALFLDFRDADDLQEELEQQHEDHAPEQTLNVEQQQQSTNDEIPRPLPFIDVDAGDFTTNFFLFICDLFKQKEIEHHFSDIYEFLVAASAANLKLVLDSVANPTDVASAIHRLRIIIGITPIDKAITYQYYYLFNFCHGHEFNNDDWETIISLNMSDIIEEIFTGTLYLISTNEINIAAFPHPMTLAEKEFIRCHRVWGLRSKENPLDQLDAFIKVETSLTDEGQELQLNMLEEFCKTISHKFPDLSLPSYQVTNVDDSNSGDSSNSDNNVYLNIFESITKNVNEFLNDFLEKELDRQSAILIPDYVNDVLAVSVIG